MALTPMMQQYLQVKENYKDCILFFRLGDFYEMFFEDAEVAAKELELVLTGRDCGLENRAPMCGIPFHAANSYVGRLVGRGYKIAICEQLEDPSAAKGIVRRDVIKVFTPGTYTDAAFLDENKNNYIMSLYINDSNESMGICFTDISTGEFTGTFCRYDNTVILDEISKFNPREIIIQEDLNEKIISEITERFNVLYTRRQEDYFTKDAEINLQKQFGEIKKDFLNEYLLSAANGLLNYIFETQKISLSNINTLDYYNVIDYLSMDINSRKNLEITETLRDKNKRGSLLWVLDKTNTAMGGRQLRKWLEQPLIVKKDIEKRVDAIEELINKRALHEDLKEALKQIYDIERIIGKISSKSVNAKELLSLKKSVSYIPNVRNIISGFNSDLLSCINNDMDELKDIYEILDKAIDENPSISLKEGNLIKEGYNQLVDELKNSKSHGKEWIASLEMRERELTGIKSLKVGYNKVFGYYIEVTNANLASLEEGRYIRKQTLSNAERFITPELKEMEDKILGAEEKLINIEYDLFIGIRDEVEKQIDRMKNTARLISDLDCLSSLATVALENNYCKPVICESGEIIIEEGRHPVVEQMIPSGSFVANDTTLNNEEDQMLLITGPNMAGKSTYMRQVALITIMAQIGSFVPAKRAEVSICDRIFTRIGASDDLAAGKSTFMVEMWEVSNILKNASNKSLVILDEVGRGTSTYDGLSIAWAVIEYICKNENIRSKTLFATHYHELTKLEGMIKGVKNYSVSVKELGNDIVFLRKIVSGGADQSYGIEVAKLAGLPDKVIDRAKEILLSLEDQTKSKAKEEVAVENNDEHESKKESFQNKGKRKNQPDEIAVSAKDSLKQISFYDIEKEDLIKEITSIDILNLTPMEGFNKLYELIKKAKEL